MVFKTNLTKIISEKPCLCRQHKQDSKMPRFFPGRQRSKRS